jgi:hypothetical protein
MLCICIPVPACDGTSVREEITMSQDPNSWTDPSNSVEAEVRYLVENTDVSPEQAKRLVKEHGPDRTKLLRLAKTMKAES